MPKLKSPTFKIVVGTSTTTPADAARDAEKNVRAWLLTHPGFQQISIAACVLGGGFDPVLDQMLDNIAKNIYQLVQCTCPIKIGQDITKPGVPPPIPLFPIGTTSGGQLWVVYVLLRR